MSHDPTWPNAFAHPGRWFKGQLHVHSTVSDGKRSPEAVLDWYHARGYHFVSLTDHNVLSRAQRLAEDFITISGIEVDGADAETGLYHLVGVGLASEPDLSGWPNVPMQESVNRLRARGGRVFVAHPYWSGQRSGDLLGLEGCLGLEVYNGGCEVLECKGLSAVHWDDLLAAGRPLWGLAVDDAHWLPGPEDAGLGWVWVKAAGLDQEAILAALEAGQFYSSSGPEIYEFGIDLERGEAHVRCSPVASIDIIGSGPYSRRFLAPAGQSLTQITHRLRERQRYVRVVCRDAQGRCAWSNPIVVREGR